MRGIKGVQAKVAPKQARLPITPELLFRIRQMWSAADGSSKWDNIMLWAACLLCFFGFLRFGEITVPAFDERAHLSFSDVAVDSTKSPKILRVHIKASKTDPFRVGVDVFVGRTDNDLCPVSAVLVYMSMRPGPLFRFQDNKPFASWQSFVKPS